MNFDVAEKYGKAYFMPPEVTYDWVKKDAKSRRSGAAWICVMATRH